MQVLYLAEKEWLIKLKDGEYRISLKHGALLRKYYVKLNGDIINPQRTIIEKGDKLTFNINSHSCVLLIYFIEGGAKYECVIDGTSIETQKKSEIPPEWSPPKQGCLKQILMQLWYLISMTIVIGIISALTGLGSAKIDLIIGLAFGVLIIYVILRHLYLRSQ